MAEDKKGFLLYCDTINSIEHLTNEEKGILFQHLLEYVNDLNPVLEDRVLIGVWKHIENQLKRDLKKYKAKVSKSSLAGREGNLKRWNLDLYEEYKKGVYTLLGAESIAIGRKGSLPDKPESGGVAKIADKDNVTVNDIDKDKDINKALPFSFYNSLLKLGASKNLVSEWLKVRKNKKATNSETAFKSFKKQLETSKQPIDKVLELCVVNSWSGFKADWYKEVDKPEMTKQQIYEEKLKANPYFEKLKKQNK